MGLWASRPVNSEVDSRFFHGQCTFRVPLVFIKSRWHVNIVHAPGLKKGQGKCANTRHFYTLRAIQTKKIEDSHDKIAQATDLHLGMSSTDQARKTNRTGNKMAAHMLKKASNNNSSSHRKKACLMQMLQEWRGRHRFGGNRNNNGSHWMRKVMSTINRMEQPQKVNISGALRDHIW